MGSFFPFKMPAKKDPKQAKGGAKPQAKSGGGKAKKKKWSKGKVREKTNNLVLFDKATFEKLMKDVPKYKLVTPSVVLERMKINGSLARRAIKLLHQKKLLRRVATHNGQLIYTRATNEEE